jgi:hypothetical protein
MYELENVVCRSSFLKYKRNMVNNYKTYSRALMYSLAALNLKLINIVKGKKIDIYYAVKATLGQEVREKVKK